MPSLNGIRRTSQASSLRSERGIPSEKVDAVLNGPEETIFRPCRPEHRPAPAQTFEIVTHETILERFGIQMLIQALRRIIEQIPNVRVTVIGEGEYRAALEELAHRTGVFDRVRIRGWVPLDQLPGVLGRFDVLYVGMLCNNMLSNKLMEDVALGLPVVAARWPTYEQYFDDDAITYFEAGSPESLADAIVGVHRDRPTALRRAGRASDRCSLRLVRTAPRLRCAVPDAHRPITPSRGDARADYRGAIAPRRRIPRC